MRDAGGGISGVYDAGDCTGILRMAGKGSQRRGAGGGDPGSVCGSGDAEGEGKNLPEMGGRDVLGGGDAWEV